MKEYIHYCHTPEEASITTLIINHFGFECQTSDHTSERGERIARFELKDTTEQKFQDMKLIIEGLISSDVNYKIQHIGQAKYMYN